MHKYVEDINILLEFELLYGIEFLLKWNKFIFYRQMLKFEFTS